LEKCAVNAVYDINKAYIGAIILSMELDLIRGYIAYPDDKKVKIPLKIVLKWE